MQQNINYSENGKYFLINDVIKIEPSQIPYIKGIRNLSNLIKLEDNLWYYKDKTLIEILFNISNYNKIKFINNDSNDYRVNNIEIIYNQPYKFKEPPNVVIIEYGDTKKITIGAYAGQHRNMYWKVKDTQNEQFYIMHIYEDIYTKISIDNISKVLNINNERPTWYLHSNMYIATMIKQEDKKVAIYMHQYIMDCHLENNTDMNKTVDHINRDKFDNRRENLRFASMSEQNKNKGRSKRPCTASVLPDYIQQLKLPKFVSYNKRCYDKNNNSWREFFTIENHPKNVTNVWSSSKSNNVSIKDKYEQYSMVK